MVLSKGKREARTQMSADRQRQITELCHAALERNASDRAAFLREACAGDEALRQEVESLLRYEDAADRFWSGLPSRRSRAW